MIQFIQRLIILFFSAGLLTVVVSCGGSSENAVPADTTGTTQNKGTVGILLTDKPADPALFSSIYASIDKVELLGSDDQGKVTLYSGETQVFDLLRLRNESIPFAFNDDVPAGTYCKIRLTLSDLELVLADDTPADATDNETDHPKLPGNGKLDLVVRDCFTVAADQVVTIQVDIDAGKSIHIVENKKGFQFRPVIFVDLMGHQFDSKLVRLNGEITEIDDVNGTLLLCDVVPGNTMRNLGCVTVHLGDNSAFFDNEQYSGAPRSTDELLTEEKKGKRVTLVGWPKYLAQKKSANDIDSVYHPLMQLEALVVELGEFLLVEGQVAVDADSTGFDMTVSTGGSIITEDALTVMYLEGDLGVNGTRIVSKSGVMLTAEDAVLALPVQVDGTLLIDGSNPVLQAALVILDKNINGAEQVTGTILTVESTSITLNPEADTVCGIATDDLLVNLTADVEILSVTITDDISEIVPGGALEAGQVIGMNGSCELSGYQTNNIVIVDDQRI